MRIRNPLRLDADLDPGLAAALCVKVQRVKLGNLAIVTKEPGNLGRIEHGRAEVVDVGRGCGRAGPPARRAPPRGPARPRPCA